MFEVDGTWNNGGSGDSFFIAPDVFDVPARGTTILTNITDIIKF